MKRSLSLVCCVVSSSPMLLSIYRNGAESIKAGNILDDYFSLPLNIHFLIRYQVYLRLHFVFDECRGSAVEFFRLSGFQSASLVCLKQIKAVLVPCIPSLALTPSLRQRAQH